jgi:hypothetical protein
MSGFSRKNAKINARPDSARPKRDKFADADKVLGEGALGDAASSQTPPATKTPTQQNDANRDLSPHNDRGLAGRVGYSMYQVDVEAVDSIRHRLYMQGIRLNSSEAARFAIAVLNSYSDQELLALHAEYGPSQRRKS